VAAELRESLEMIRRNIELEARLINDLLDVVRASRGRLTLDLRRVDAHDTIHQAFAVCHPEISAAGLELSLELLATEHQVKADPARLQQALWNLTKNATNYTPRGGSLAIRTRNQVGDGEDSPGGRLVVEVADDGIGIAPEILTRIFEPFEQGDPALRRRSGGLGLGLAISRSVVEAHGGRLTVASAGRGRGSTFTLDLATDPGPAPATPPPSSPPCRHPGARALNILVVEDNKDILRAIAWSCASTGCGPPPIWPRHDNSPPSRRSTCS
jgi:signal transduction histidine kinase